jgi:hypothetical protein
MARSRSTTAILQPAAATAAPTATSARGTAIPCCSVINAPGAPGAPRR